MRSVGTRREDVVVFVGPSLPVQHARPLCEARYLPPADRGAVHHALRDDPKVIVLLDGVFGDAAPVAHRELLDALEDGVTVIGASGAGALRAVELAPLGMVGCGQVYRWFQSGALDADDEVALRHDADDGYRALSESLVNIRATLAAAVRAGALARPHAGELIEYARTLYYPLRRWSTLLSSPVATAWSAADRERLITHVAARRVDVQQADARAALRMAARTAPPDGGSTTRRLHTLGRTSLAAPAAAGGPDGSGEAGELLRRARAEEPELLARLRRQASRRFFAGDWAGEQGVRCPSDALPGFARRWAAEHRLDLDADWWRANGLTPVTYWRLLVERADADWVTSHPGPLPGMHGRPTTGALPGEDRAVLAWALLRGVLTDLPRTTADQLGVCRWIVARGPAHFGLPWREDEALLEELRMTGAAARLAAPPLEVAI